MESLRIEATPETRDPILIMAFSGWNDAAGAATSAARFLAERLGGKRFAWIEPEPYFQFSEIRPLALNDETGRRRLRWPKNEFFLCRHPSLPRDVAVGLGIEPHFEWRRFSREVLEVARRLRVREAVTMGALLSAYPHKDPVPIVGLATSSELARRLGVEITKYEGPTGIVGVIHTLFQDEGMPAVSLWANVPHYIAALPNPKAVHGLLERFSRFGGIPLDLSSWEEAIASFHGKVDEYLSKNPHLSSYVSLLQDPSEEGDGGLFPEGEDIEGNFDDLDEEEGEEE